MRSSEITYGEARDVSDWLHGTDMDNIGHGDLIGALVNALNRIDALEKRLAKAEQSLAVAANTASCLANGIKPD